MNLFIYSFIYMFICLFIWFIYLVYLFGLFIWFIYLFIYLLSYDLFVVPLCSFSPLFLHFLFTVSEQLYRELEKKKLVSFPSFFLSISGFLICFFIPSFDKWWIHVELIPN